ncbi:PAS domain-containing protein [Saliphagus sp. GCM10025317]
MTWTESMERLFGLEPGTFEGTFEAFAKRVHPDDRPAVQSAIETAIEQDDVFQLEYRILRDDGEQRWGYARAETYGFEDGNGRMVGIVTDITKRKEQERRLHRQDLQYRQLVNRLPEAYYTFDRDWTLTYCNEVLAERLETTVDELIGTSVWEVIPGARGSILEETFQEAKERQEVTSCEFYVEDYEYWIEAQAYPYEDGVAVISADITDQKEKFGMVLDSMPLIFYRIDSEGVFQESRGKGLTMLGLEPGAVVGESVFDVYAANPEILEAVERTLEGEEVSLTFEVENHYFQSQFRPIVEDDDVTELIGISMDITELERQREQMEFFNSILRHDVLNGMTIIKTRGELLADQLEGEHGRYARTIVDWCDATTAVTKRVQRVIETLTTPNEESQVMPVDAGAILRRKLDELQNAHPEVTFVDDFDSSVSVRADELLSDVLANLLSNSIEHNDTDGLRVEVTIETDDADAVTIRIADNGIGIADERKEGVFRRGATSHVKETGSGFGLFFVDVMVEKYGGEVWVTDNNSGGACFVLELPKANGGTKT